MREKVFLIMGIPLLLILAIITYYALPWLYIYIGIQSGPNPPRPEITYGEFPFRLEYEINGRRMVIQDTLIIEYDGISADEGRGKDRRWKQKLASGNERITLLKIDDKKEIFYSPGSAKYYMGELEDSWDYHIFPNAVYIEKDGRIETSGLISSDDLQEQYNIKLISWDYTPPIKNNFSTDNK